MNTDSGKGGEKIAYRALNRKIEILRLLAYGEVSVSDIAAQYGCHERTIGRLRERAANWEPDLVRDLPESVQKYLVSLNPKLKSELEESDKTEEEHWQELTRLVTRLLYFWERSLGDYPGDCDEGLVINEHDLKDIDPMIADSLVCHLKAEFVEFQKVEEWSDLVSLKLVEGGVAALDRLTELKTRKTFKGNCTICES